MEQDGNQKFRWNDGVLSNVRHGVVAAMLGLAAPVGAVGTLRHDGPIVIVGPGGNSGRAMCIAAGSLSLLSRASEGEGFGS